uniref:Alpha-methylacyl-CoA racemase n=1 Tax=Oncorhynchus kisutch TaxID=8019 RepID=A0A8C7GKN2_ONCKI
PDSGDVTSRDRPSTFFDLGIRVLPAYQVSKLSSLFLCRKPFLYLSINCVSEKLGMGPEELLKENPRLIYSCLTGYGLSGAKAAGHDINYLVMSGLFSMLGRSHEKPYAPLNLVADFAGEGLTCAFGVVLVLLERTRLGRGQVIDDSMVRMRSAQLRSEQITTLNMDDGSTAYIYLCSSYLVRCISLFIGLGLDAINLPPQMSICDWPELRQRVWSRVRWDRRDLPPHNQERASFHRDAQREVTPSPAPVLSRTPADPCLARDTFIGEHTRPVPEESGFKPAEVKQLLLAGIIESNAAKVQL